jgi:hypothetical protein
METRLVGVQDLDREDLEAWNVLAERAVEPNPFFEPGFLVLAARHFDGFAGTRLLIASEGSAWRAMLAVIGVGRPRIPPRPCGTTSGVPTAISGLSTPLVDREHVDEATGALLDGLQREAKAGRLPGILSLNRVDEHGPVVAALRQSSAIRGMPVFTKETWTRGLVTRTGQWEQPVSPQRRSKNARRRRMLARDTGLELSVVDRTHDPTAPEEFLKLEASGWKGRGHGTAFARDQAKIAWFHEWVDHWTQTGRVTLLALNVGDTSIAFRYILRAGEGSFLFRTAYDANYAKYGPGSLLLESVLAMQFEQTEAIWLDSSTDPDNSFLLEMLPERRTISMLLIGTGGTVDRRVISTMPIITRGVNELRRVRFELKRLRHRESAASAGGQAR